ncbi:hypothetical protein ACN47E_006864 [Coniothyrium glycines]
MDDDSVLVEKDLSMSILRSSSRVQHNTPSDQTAQISRELPDWHGSNKVDIRNMTSQQEGKELEGSRNHEVSPHENITVQHGMVRDAKAREDPITPLVVNMAACGLDSDGNGLPHEFALPSCSSPPPALPPPPPGIVPHLVSGPPLPPPPPPPVPGPFPGTLDYQHCPDDEVLDPSSFLPVRHTGDSVFEHSSHVLRLAPFRRDVYVALHKAHPADFEEHKWLLQYGDSELWYEKPSRAHLRSLRNHESSKWGADELIPLLNARPVSLETPKVWSSSALITPTNDDIYDCTVRHSMTDADSGNCHRYTEHRSKALERTPLVYCLVLSTCQASDPFINGAHFNGRQIYKLIRCGSREAAVSEAFHSAGANGWNVIFSCIFKFGEDFQERPAMTKVKRAEHLWMLAEEAFAEASSESSIRVFY